jgi:hypothetical protein
MKENILRVFLKSYSLKHLMFLEVTRSEKNIERKEKIEV